MKITLNDINSFLNEYYNDEHLFTTSRQKHAHKAYFCYLSMKYATVIVTSSSLARYLNTTHGSILNLIKNTENWIKGFDKRRALELGQLEQDFLVEFDKKIQLFSVTELDKVKLMRYSYNDKKRVDRWRAKYCIEKEKTKNQALRISKLTNKIEKLEKKLN